MATFRLFSRYFLQKRYDPIFGITPVSVICNRSLNYLSKEYNDKDPAPLFFDKEVQSLLKTLTRVNLNKVFRQRKFGQQRLDLPTYKFVADEELEKLRKDAEERKEELLQMPPVVKARVTRDRILSRDPTLTGYDTAKYVFTDITFGLKDVDRFIVVRETDGTLREVDWALRDRINQIYFPLPGREIRMPLMFQDRYFEDLLKRQEYEFILDRSCIQFEPDDQEYQRVTTITYQHLSDNNGFEILRSTRHFGPLAFFLTWNKEIDNLLLDLIQTSNAQEANILLQLYDKFYDTKLNMKDLNNVKGIEKYIKEFSNKRASLELALQAYNEIEEQRKSIEQDIKHAHGVV